MSASNQLPIPPAASNDSQGFEVARIWIAGGQQHVMLLTEIWDDPAAWGIMLVDLARHVAHAYARDHHISINAALQRVRDGFDAEWDSPTSAVTGE